jgi:phosphoribosylamine-glycine ligase
MVDTDNNIKVLEYNCRLGDPETQNLMLYLTNKGVSLLNLIENNPKLPVQDYNLDRLDSKNQDYCCTIVLAAKGYPESYKKDFFIDLSGIKENEHIKIFHSGTVMQNSKIKAIGGRILSVNVYSENKEKAVKKAYNAIEAIRCYEDEEFSVENNDYVFYREDIGQ